MQLDLNQQSWSHSEQRPRFNQLSYTVVKKKMAPAAPSGTTTMLQLMPGSQHNIQD
jgi:hypothetical protein